MNYNMYKLYSTIRENLNGPFIFILFALPRPSTFMCNSVQQVLFQKSLIKMFAAGLMSNRVSKRQQGSKR